MRRKRSRSRGGLRIDPKFLEIVPFLAPKLRRQILIELGHGLSTTAELVDHLSVPASRIAYQLERLVDRRLVRARGQGRSRSYRLGPAVQVTEQEGQDVLTVSVGRSSISVGTTRVGKTTSK